MNNIDHQIRTLEKNSNQVKKMLNKNLQYQLQKKKKILYY